METRKIQRVSHGTFTVSLPREWATDQGLSAGDVVNVHPHLDGSLTIQPAADDTDRIELAIGDETPDQLGRLLRAAYAVGSLRTDLTSEEGFDDGQLSAIRSTARALSGVTIGEESGTRLTVRNVLDSEQVSVRQSVRHLRFVALSRHREATAALCDPEVAAGAAVEDARGDRLSTMVERYFVRSLLRLDEVDALGERRPELFGLYRTADELARVASSAGVIASVAAETDAPCPIPADDVAAEIEAAAADARDAVDAAVDSVFDPDPDAVWSVLAARDDLCGPLADLERRVFESPGGDYRIGRAIGALRQTTDSAASIASVGLRRAVCEGTLAERPSGVDADDASGSPVPTNSDN